jgi:tetratricopeptide (TPR) repeat protein
MFGPKGDTRRRLFWILVGVVVLELCLIGAAVAIKPALRAIPGRYRARLPEFVQELAAQPHPKSLPTPDVTVSFAVPTFPVTPPTPTPTPIPPTRTPLVQPPTPEDATLTPSPTPTRTPTAEPTPTFTPHSVPGPAQAARSTPADLERATALLSGFRHEYQLWNNCGPATLSMALSYYGWQGDQRNAAAFLKPDQEDKNVSPSEMATFVRQQGLEVVIRYGGNIHLIQRLLLAGFPVMVEKGFDPEPDRLGWMGHYLLIVGYNEFDRAMVTMDSYTGPSQNEPYVHLDDFWRHFNRVYLVIYRPEQEADLAAVLGDEMDPTVNLWNTLAIAIDEVTQNPNDAYAWFNLGTSYTQVGLYEDAAGSFDQARSLGLPWRMLWYQFGPYKAYYEVGRYDDMIALADATLATTLEIEESFYYKGMALQAKGDLNGARAAYQQAIDFNPNYAAAVQAISALPSDG